MRKKHILTIVFRGMIWWDRNMGGVKFKLENMKNSWNNVEKVGKKL